MGSLNIFLSGVAGAFVVYILMYRETRIAGFASNPRENWTILFIDLVVFLAAGGLVAMFVLTSPTTKEAFIAGISWQGMVGGVFSGAEMTLLRDKIKDLNKMNTEALKNIEAWRFRAAALSPDEGEELQIAPEA